MWGWCTARQEGPQGFLRQLAFSAADEGSPLDLLATDRTWLQCLTRGRAFLPTYLHSSQTSSAVESPIGKNYIFRDRTSFAHSNHRDVVAPMVQVATHTTCTLHACYMAWCRDPRACTLPARLSWMHAAIVLLFDRSRLTMRCSSGNAPTVRKIRRCAFRLYGTFSHPPQWPG